MNKPLLVTIVGPTASGKTKLAVDLALSFSGEIVSADSMQIYQGMDIGTAKPTVEEMGGVPHHLIGFLSPQKPFSVAEYARCARAAIDEIQKRNRLPFLVGGTGLYIQAVVDNIQYSQSVEDAAIRLKYQQLAAEKGGEHLLFLLSEIDPETARQLHPNNLGRIIRALEVYDTTGKPISWHLLQSRRVPSPYHAVQLGIAFKDRQKLYERINLRVDEMMRQGLLEEAEQFWKEDYGKTAAQAIGYKELEAYFTGHKPLAECVEEIKLQTRRYAKRQLTWFRRDQRIHWLYPDDYADYPAFLKEAQMVLEREM